MRERSSERARIRRLRSQYRKRMAFVAVIFLIIGLVLGILADRNLFNQKQDIPVPGDVSAVITATPAPIDNKSAVDDAQDKNAGFDEDAARSSSDAADKDYTIAMDAPDANDGAATANDAAGSAPEATPTVTPEPTPVPGPTTLAVVPFGETYNFSTQIKADGTARIVATDEPFETLNFSLCMKDYLLPSDYVTKWGTVYKLQGNEAGAGFELTLNDYMGTTVIRPGVIIKVVFQSESGDTEESGYQLSDKEINGQPDVTLQTNVPAMVWKRYAYSNRTGEELKYLAVTAFNDGVAQTILFELKSDVVPTPDPLDQYTTLTRGDKSDKVLDLQKRLKELGYLSGDADGNYGGKTQDAVRAAQKDFGMDETGTATPEFQLRLFSDESENEEGAEEDAEGAEDGEENADEEAPEEDEAAEDEENAEDEEMPADEAKKGKKEN